MQKTVLIVGQICDPHIIAVQSALLRMEAQVFVLDCSQSQQGHRLSYHLGTTCEFGVLHIEGQQCDLSEVNAVWWRLKPTTFSHPKDLNSSATKFIHREWDSVLNSLETFTGQSRWINPRLSDLRVRNKPTQLFIAHKLGFTIPPTIISNDCLSIEHFLDSRENEYIYKSLTWYFDPPNKLLFTSNVNASQVRSEPQAISIAPGIFQVSIPKAYEVRATLVGKEVFAVRIDSQSYKETRLDWRKRQDLSLYSKINLPSDIEKRLLAMNEQLGLVYAAYDLIVTPSQEYIFLEVNHVGQWLWLEEATGVPISENLAFALLE